MMWPSVALINHIVEYSVGTVAFIHSNVISDSSKSGNQLQSVNGDSSQAWKLSCGSNVTSSCRSPGILGQWDSLCVSLKLSSTLEKA